MKQKIDIVYTWVDGSDSVWRKKRETTLSKIDDTSNLGKHSNVEGRFRDNGELKYSLRSLEKYFPDHGTIYIVTDKQVPSFLKEHKNIKIIFHEDFMTSASLPTFSSKNIESFLVDIQGVSDIFFYFNDDVFLGPDFQIEDLYNEKPVYYFAPWLDVKVHPPLVSASSSEVIMRNSYSNYSHFPFYSVHTPKVIVKKDFLEMKEEFPQWLNKIQAEIFRNIRNPSLLADLYPRWMIHHQKGLVGSKEDIYIQSGDDEYDKILQNFKNIAFFCINDTGDNLEKKDISLIKISETLEYLFPEKSSYER